MQRYFESCVKSCYTHTSVEAQNTAYTPLAALDMIRASACCWQTGARSASEQTPTLSSDAAIHLRRFTNIVQSLATGFLDPAIIDTLETLADLREDGRRRFVKRRTKEELEEILVAILQEQDEKKNEESQGKWLICITIQRQ